MRRNALLSSLLSVAVLGFAATSQAAAVTTLNNPTTWRVTLSGIKYEPSNYSKCANLSDARMWNSYYWCPVSVGTLSATEVAKLNSTPTPIASTQTTTTTTTTPSIAFLDNPTTWRVSLSGVKYEPSDYSKCADKSTAKLWNSYYWCPVSVGTLSATQVAQINSTPTTTTPTTTTPTAPTSSFSVSYLDNPTTWRVTLSGVKYEPSDYSKCADKSSAKLWNSYYWCPVSVGVLDAAKVAALTGSTGNVTTPTPTPTPTPAPTAPVTSTYTAKLSWVAPSTREDGTPLSLSELKGYEIHYTSDDLTQGVTVPVSTASTTSYAVSNLKPGTYHFAITAVDSKGLKSQLSSMVSARFGS